ncbi:UNKNOWN [Stylonychia lemnae]|uniref:Uncharacterized protein n=1 Tax=Stylonychia lemnae TaxID=5949 RepID=A0A078AAK3_STYLE|nr:UNKNOWN [Stylonychia lemnae]|eukprot:CDW79244.1 UNKNOWN [Stylonychia lemnae]
MPKYLSDRGNLDPNTQRALLKKQRPQKIGLNGRKRFSRSYTFQTSSSSSGGSGGASNGDSITIIEPNKLSSNILYQIVDSDQKFIQKQRKRNSLDFRQQYPNQSTTMIIDISFNQQQENIDLSNIFKDYKKPIGIRSDKNLIIEKKMFQETRSDFIEQSRRSIICSELNEKQLIRTQSLKSSSNSKRFKNGLSSPKAETRTSSNIVLISSCLQNIQVLEKQDPCFQSHYKHYFQGGDTTPKLALHKKTNSFNNSQKSSHRSLSFSQQEIGSPINSQHLHQSEIDKESAISQYDNMSSTIKKEEVDLKVLCNLMANCFVNVFTLNKRRYYFRLTQFIVQDKM